MLQVSAHLSLLLLLLQLNDRLQLIWAAGGVVQGRGIRLLEAAHGEALRGLRVQRANVAAHLVLAILLHRLRSSVLLRLLSAGTANRTRLQ